MSHRVLFVATLHHPQQLIKDRAAAPKEDRPLFPTSMGQHFWERAMKRQGWTLDVFWRNLPGFGLRDIRLLRPHRHRQRITFGKLISALMRRLPARLNWDYRMRNAALVLQAREFRPDILWFIGDNTVIYPDTLRIIKEETGCKIVYASGTSPIVFTHPIERAAARLYDLVLVNDYYHGIQWLELGAKAMSCLPVAAIDPDFHHPYTLTPEAQARYTAEITFVGTLVPDNLYSERVAALEAVADLGLGVWSVHDVPASLRPYYRGEALGEEMFRVLSAAKISINAHGDFMRYGGNMRLFEAAAVGAFQLVDNRPGVHEWFTDGEHLVTYNSPADLREKVQYYLAHPEARQAIANAAREHVLAHHTYDHRMEAAMALMKKHWGWDS